MPENTEGHRRLPLDAASYALGFPVKCVEKAGHLAGGRPCSATCSQCGSLARYLLSLISSFVK